MCIAQKKGVRNIIKLLHPGQTRAPGAKRGAHTTARKACYLTSPGLKPASSLTACVRQTACRPVRQQAALARLLLNLTQVYYLVSILSSHPMVRKSLPDVDHVAMIANTHDLKERRNKKNIHTQVHDIHISSFALKLSFSYVDFLVCSRFGGAAL